MRFSAFFGAALGSLLFSSQAFGEGAVSGGRGGPFLEIHGASLSQFDSNIAGKPVVIGGSGFGYSSKNFRIGGGGGGGFLWNPSDNVQFGMGYGGAIGEYVIASWLAFRLMVGGGGFTIGKVLSDTESAKSVQKISSGGFILFYPGISGEIPITASLKVSMVVGYFLPNVTKLQGWTFTINLQFGKG